MRRMYSQAELSAIIKEVFLSDVASGEIDLPALIEQALPEIDWSEFELDCKSVKADSIIENMSGYSFTEYGTATNTTREWIYSGIVKNGNKLTGVIALNLTNTTGTQDNNINIGRFYLPTDILASLYPTTIGLYDMLVVNRAFLISQHNQPLLNINYYIEKGTTYIDVVTAKVDNMVQNTKYYLRVEFTFLLSENLAE